jgi:transposase
MVRAALWRQYLKLHNLVVRLVARHALCRRFMAIHGVGRDRLDAQYSDRRS